MSRYTVVSRQNFDTAITDLKNKNSELQSDITSLQSDVSETKSDISTNTATIASEAKKVVALQRQVSALYKLNEGQTYEYQTDSTKAYSKTVLSGSIAGTVDSFGGRSVVWNQLVEDEHYDEQNYNNHSVDIGDTDRKVKVESIGGKTIVWNQLFDSSAFNGKTSNGVTFEVTSDNKIHVSGTPTSTYATLALFTPIVSHVYFVKSENANYEFMAFNCNRTAVASNTQNDKIVKVTSSTGRSWGFRTFTTGEAIDEYFTLMIIDLTQMFGSGNEPSTVEEFEVLFPEEYYPYNAGELMSIDTRTVTVKNADDTEVKTFTVPSSVPVLHSALTTHDEIVYDADAETWSYIKRVNIRAYEDGDTDYTDGTNTAVAMDTAADPVDITDAMSAFVPVECESGGSITFIGAGVDNEGNQILAADEHEVPVPSILAFEHADYTVLIDSTHSYVKVSDGTPSIVSGESSVSVNTDTDNLVDMTRMLGSGNEPTDTSDNDVVAISTYAAVHSEYNAGEIISADVSGVKAQGANLLPEVTLTLGSISSTTGVEAKNESSKTNAYTDYVAIGNGTYYFCQPNLLTDGNPVYTYCYCYDYNYNYIGQTTVKYIQNRTFSTIDGTAYIRFMLYASDQTIANCTNPMALYKGETSKDYVPYTVTTLPIPDAVRALPGYGWTGNTIDWSNKKYIRTVESQTIDADGNLSQTLYDTPVETDISDILPDDNFFNTETGGSLTFEQDGTELPVPNTETMVVKLSEVSAS